MIAIRGRSGYSIVLTWIVALAAGIGLAAGVALAGNEESLPDTAARIKPSIVGVGSYQRSRQPPRRLLGTGFVVGDGRHVLTNLHVMPKKLDDSKQEVLAVFVGAGEDAAVRLAAAVAEDAEHDLLLLKFSDAPLPPLVLGDSEKVREGQLYAFTGFPMGSLLGLFPVTHRGIISAIVPALIPFDDMRQLTPELVEHLKAPYKVFELDATAYPGNSGSPLYDPVTGAVIGIVNKVFIQERKENALEKPSGISFAVPSRYAQALLVKAGL